MARCVALVAVLALAVACRGRDEFAARAALRPVTLPDVSRASPSLQARIRERHAKLTHAIDLVTTPPADLADAYGDMGKLFIAAEYLDQAEACFANARALVPADMRWPYFLGHVARFKNQPGRAASFFEQALALRQDDVPTLVWLADVYLAQRRLDDAASLLTRAQRLQPQAAVLYGLGRVALAQQDYASAVEHLEAALKAAPEATRIHDPLAAAYRGLGRIEQAETHLRQRGDVEVTPFDPLMGEVGALLQDAVAFATRGAQALEARRWADAVTYLRKAIELQPNDAYARLNLGTALQALDDGEGALEQYRGATALMPDLAKAHFAIGVLMEARQRDREAIDAFAAAVRAEPVHDEARLRLADALRRTGRTGESLPHYEEILRHNPSASDATFGHAIGLVRVGRYLEARDALAAGTRTFPEEPGFAHALARLLAAAPDDRVRDGPRALTLMRDLVRGPQTISLAETMAMIEADVGKFDEAARWQRQAIGMARQAGRPDLIAPLTRNLRLYERRQPCRVPWADDDPIHRPGT